MNARISILVGACVVVVLSVVGLTVVMTSTHAVATSTSGDFATRFQPTLDGIGSTRDLRPVPLGDASPAASPAPSNSVAAKARHHERAAVRP